MNRPFYAFGILLAFLALAMVAVGLSSRPATQLAPATSASSIGSPRSGVGGVAYLLAVPDTAEAEAPAAADDGALASGNSQITLCTEPCYADGCGLDRATGQVYAWQPPAMRGSLRPARIALASRLAAPAEPGSLDCRAHYDAAYDTAVYGRTTTEQSAVLDGDAADPTVTLFNSLLGEQAQHAQPAPQRKAARKNWRYQLQALMAGVGNQLWRSATRLGLDDEWLRTAAWVRPLARSAAAQSAVASGPSWSDYENWIASLQPAVASQYTPVGGAVRFQDLAWRQVVQIAVSWLNHAAKTLDLAADQLNAAASPSTVDQIGAGRGQSRSR